MHMKNFIRLPIWFLSLFTGAKSFRDNPIIGSKRFNRLGLHMQRVKLSHSLAWHRRKKLGSGLSQDLLAEFEANGFITIADFLPEGDFTLLREEIYSRAFPAREMVQGNTITRRIAINAEYLRAAPTLRAMLASGRWRKIMWYVSSFSIEPLYYVQTIIKQDNGAEEDPQTILHADTFHPTMKAWLFLHDVGEDDGPFSYVPGSHKMTPQRLDWEKEKSIIAPEGLDYLSSRGSMRISGDELPALGLPPAKKFPVRANTLVVADTSGFHARAISKSESCRVEIWAYSRRNPFIPWAGGDILSLPGIAERRIDFVWKFRDMFQRWMGQPWQFRGVMKPDDLKK